MPCLTLCAAHHKEHNQPDTTQHLLRVTCEIYQVPGYMCRTYLEYITHMLTLNFTLFVVFVNRVAR